MAGVVGTVRAQAITLSGTVTSTAGASPAGTTVEVVNPANRRDRERAAIGEDGGFDVIMPEAEVYEVGYYNDRFNGRYVREPDDLPLLYHFGTAEASEGGTLGEFSLPEAHVVQIQCVDTDGNPIEGLPVNFRDAGGTGAPPGLFSTTANGFVKFADMTETGVELSGETRVEVQPPSQSGNPDGLQTVYVTEPRDIQLRVFDPTRYPGVSVNDGNTDANPSSPLTKTETSRATPRSTTEPATATPATRATPPTETANPQSSSTEVSSGRSRGFFSNRAGGEEPTGPLSNAVNLTTLGFLLSVAGIGYQLIEGR